MVERKTEHALIFKGLLEPSDVGKLVVATRL
jgi:hypothetical protein